MKAQIEIFAIVFVCLFLLGGTIGSLSLPAFAGRFFISGLVFAIFGTGLGKLFISKKL